MLYQMDEDGVVAYFQDSPAAHHLHALEELIILNGVEEGEGGLLPHKDQWRCECVYGVGVKAWSWLLAAITWPVHETLHLERLVQELRQSSLLTDQDHHLLQSALANNHDHVHSHTHSMSLLSRCLLRVRWLLLATIITFSLLTYCVYHAHPLLPLSLFVLFLLIWWQLLSCWVEVVLTKAQSWRHNYYQSFDELLSQLMSTLRWLQEVEVIGRGFARPLQTLGATSLLDGCSGMHRHAHLRRRLLATSFHLLRLLRETTREVYAQEHVGKKMEYGLADKLGYLAYTPLTHLHPHLLEDKEVEEEEELNIDSIKDTCSLLAVQNSELLRLICLIVASTVVGVGGGRGGGARGWCVNDILLVRRLSVCVGRLVREVKLGTRELTWALNFNKNMLLETTPTRPLVAITEQRYPMNSDLQSVADQLHCLDLKTHCLLQRVRAFGCSLSSGEEMEGVKGLTVEMAAVTVCVRGVVDSCELLSSVLQHTLQDKEDVQDREREEEVIEVHAGEADLAGDDKDLQEGEEGEDFDEEKVYEGYVQEEDLPSYKREQEESSRDKSLEAKQVSVYLLHELQSVLILKKEEKERKRQLRRIRQQLHTEHAQAQSNKDKEDAEHAQSNKDKEDAEHAQSNKDEEDAEHAQSNKDKEDAEHSQSSMEATQHAQITSKELENWPTSFGIPSSMNYSRPRHMLSGQLMSAIMRRRNMKNEVTFT